MVWWSIYVKMEVRPISYTYIDVLDAATYSDDSD